MISWRDALKEWNDKTQKPYRYSVPLKGSPENVMIKQMMKGKKFRLRPYEPQRVYEEVDDKSILDLIRQAEEMLKNKPIK